ncbi:hypothetical protein [Streptomyces sp. NBC_00470]|uniref:hypothetical protein n=1 Tax=Streptomyces sp. NBC_00470 TaxID=2975753 RepID=UPI002F91A2ED
MRVLKYLLPVEDYLPVLPVLDVQPATPADIHHFHAEGDAGEVDDTAAPTRITLLADTEDDAWRMAHRHLTLCHARHAYAHPGTLPATRQDKVYAAARDRAKTLTAQQRWNESTLAVCGEDSHMALHALWDVLREYGELPTP